MSINSLVARPTIVHLWRAIGALVIAALLLGPATAALADHEAQGGLLSETHYVSPQFFFELEWDAPWTVDPAMVQSVTGEYDLIVVGGPGGLLQGVLVFGDDLERVLNGAIDIRAQSAISIEILGWDEGTNERGFPYLAATLAYEAPSQDGGILRLMEYVEVSSVYDVDLGPGIADLSLVAPAGGLADAFNDVQATFLYNQGANESLFAGQPAVDGVGTAPSRGRSGSAGAGDAESAYLATLTAEIDALTDSVEDFYNLLNDPTLDAQTQAVKLQGILDSWIAAYETALSLAPPPGYEAVHFAYLSFTELLAGAAIDLYDSDITSAVAKLTQAQEEAVILGELLEEATGSDLLDRRSG